VTRNYSEKTINGILDYVGGGKGGPIEVDVLEKFYQATKKALEDAKNDVRSFISTIGEGFGLTVVSCSVYQQRPISSSRSCGLTARNTAACPRYG
jgi:hypothetical protein